MAGSWKLFKGIPGFLVLDVNTSNTTALVHADRGGQYAIGAGHQCGGNQQQRRGAVVLLGWGIELRGLTFDR